MDQRFPREHRLRLKREFDRVFELGRRVHSMHFMVVAAPGPQLGHHRIGIIVSGKIGNAVARNRIKRSVREFYRTRKKYTKFAGVPEGMDIVVVARKGAAERDFYKICEELESCWQKL